MVSSSSQRPNDASKCKRKKQNRQMPPTATASRKTGYKAVTENKGMWLERCLLSELFSPLKSATGLSYL